jgi:hypothetical protein
MAKDAYVMVVCKRDSYSAEDIYQMIGRGNRSFGRCKGKVYLEDDFVVAVG